MNQPILTLLGKLISACTSVPFACIAVNATPSSMTAYLCTVRLRQ
ncbi:MAG: hypothetical protein ACRC6P_00345 [Shewanella oncorhynchi]